MPAPIVQADYEQLQAIAERFSANSDTTQQMTQLLRQMTESLHDGGWIGRGSDAFNHEMTAEVLPALERLLDALQQSSAVTIDMSQLIQEAEEDAAAPFTGETNGSGLPATPGGLGPGGLPAGPGGSGPGGAPPSPGGLGPGGLPPGTTSTRQRTGLDTGAGSSLAGSGSDADTLVDSQGRWVHNKETGEWERQPIPDDAPSRVTYEAVLYENKDLLLYGDSVIGDEWEGSYGRVSADALGYQTQGQVKLAVNAKDGLVASGSVSGEAYLGRAEYEGQFGPNIANLEAKGDLLVGAQATVGGQAVFNTSNVYISAGGEALVGATAGGEIKGNISDYGSVGANGKVGAGLGVEGKFDFGYRDGTFRLDAGLGAYLGLGLSGGFTVEVKPVEIIKDVGSGLSQAGGWIKSKFGW